MLSGGTRETCILFSFYFIIFNIYSIGILTGECAHGMMTPVFTRFKNTGVIPATASGLRGCCALTLPVCSLWCHVERFSFN